MTVKSRKFKTEVQHLLNLVIHSLYTNQEIFLRELISNASDAIDRARFESLSDQAILEGDPNWGIQIHADKKNRTLTISDNGIGMHAEEVDANIGTIASSGTRFFMKQLEETGEKGQIPPELIGQFGVGFYSAFMVADKVTVITRRAGDPNAATQWESEGAGSYTVEQVTKEKRGTDVILHLKEEMDQFLDEWRIRQIVKKYSDFVEHPISMDVERSVKDGDGDEEKKEIKIEVLNSQKAIWARPRSEIKPEEYNEFYKHVAHDFHDPRKVIHWNVEGATEFRALLFLPSQAPMDFFMPEMHSRGIHLYVKRIFITDNCEALVPPWLRFLRGVVDSSDLPLNVSRETLQEERVIRVIRNNLVKKVLDTLGEMQEKERDQYEEFWGEFGRVVKEGIHLDHANREKIADLALFESTTTEPGKRTTLAEYIARMPESQKDIFYITGDSRERIAKSPLLEAFRSRQIEVLFMTDPIDEWVVQSLTKYREKNVKSIAKGDVDLNPEAAEEKKEKREKTGQKYQELIAFIKDALKDDLKDVKISDRLTASACCLVSDEMDMDVRMEQILKTMHKDMPPTKRILEINPEHNLIKGMREMVKDNKHHPRLTEYAKLLYEQSLLTAGLPIQDPTAFANRISNLMAAETAKAQS